MIHCLSKDLDSEADRRTVVVDRLYLYQTRGGDGIGLIGYVLVDLETGWHVKRFRARRDAVRWAVRRGWTVVEK